ncbi:MAG: sulfotransferase [Chitinophagales bacterium]|nr:sulfotransferase [Chitinophagales bacterium]
MTIFKPSIFYFHHQTVFQLFYFNCIKHFSIPRFLFTTTFLFLHLLGVVFIAFGRIMDEIFFSGYKKLDLTSPVFIISNPRCGTTFLHRLLCLDGEKYTFSLLYHTLLPSVFYIKIIQLVANVDKKVGGLLHKVFNKLDELFFGGWKHVHPMGFDRSEEDEALFTLAAYSPALVLLSPWAYKLGYLNFIDKSDEKVKQKIKEFYLSSLKRIVYATKPEATLLMKNVFSTGRLNFILSCFPNAKIIYPVRNPLKAVPSVISMFTGPWKVHSRDIANDSEECRAFGKIAINYYAYLHEQKSIINPKNLLIVRYDEVVKNPTLTANKIYEYFDFEMSDAFKNALKNYTLESKNYKSKHHYSLEQYGMTEEAIYTDLKDLMNAFEFGKQVVSTQ